MARFSFLLAFAIGTVLCLSVGQSRASPLPNAVEGVADSPQIPNMPSPGDFPRPPNMAHSRLVRQAPPEVPGQEQFPPPPPHPHAASMRARRDAQAFDDRNADAFTNALTNEDGTREKRAAKGTGGKLPSKAG
ncbi:uncharacterized protein LOC126578187 [Anopheles aquasalis]|uniref:uncharacterized protein LOC126578187 n=1 Tax=Anopheles aquasalis TaxID=42839 RepID=UPI00215AEA1B|nr:uncharacterized protein LOC126578187 [Anopheles aquasalis]